MKITLSVREVADLLGVSTDCIYMMHRDKQIPGALRVRRRILFHRDVIEAWLRGTKETGGGTNGS